MRVMVAADREWKEAFAVAAQTLLRKPMGVLVREALDAAYKNEIEAARNSIANAGTVLFQNERDSSTKEAQ